MSLNLNWISWTADEIDNHADAALASKRAGLDAVFSVPDDQRTFANTIAALEHADNTAADIQQELDLLVNVHPDAVIRDAARVAVDRIEAGTIEMEYDRRLWDAMQAWGAKKEPLDSVDRKLADDILRYLRRMGFALPDEQFTELKRLTTELKKQEAQFEKAINDWEDHIEVTLEQLAGLPERYIDGLKRAGDNYIVSLEYPDLHPFMRQAYNLANTFISCPINHQVFSHKRASFKKTRQEHYVSFL